MAVGQPVARQKEQFVGRCQETAEGGAGRLTGRYGRPAARRDSRVEASGEVERAVIWPSGSEFHVAVAQVADDVVRGPVGAPGRGSPVVGSEPSQDRDEPLPLLAEHLDQVLWIEVARALGPQ